MTAVLFTCAGQRVDIVSAFGRAGATTVATDADALAPALYHADHHALVPRVDSPGYIPALAALVAAALVGWAVQTARYEDMGFAQLRRCLVENKGAPVTQTRDPIAKIATLGAVDTVIETNPVTVAVADDEGEAERLAANYRMIADDLGARLEVRGRTVYLWEREPSPTQRQALFDCTY